MPRNVLLTMLSREKEIKYLTHDSQVLIFIDPFFFHFTVLQKLIKKLSLKIKAFKYQKRASEGVSSLEFWCWIKLIYEVQV